MHTWIVEDGKGSGTYEAETLGDALKAWRRHYGLPRLMHPDRCIRDDIDPGTENLLDVIQGRKEEENDG